MCRFVIVYRLRTDASGAPQNVTPISDEVELERMLTSLRGGSEATTIKVFTLAQVFERVPSWVERDPNEYIFASKAPDTTIGAADESGATVSASSLPRSTGA